MGRGAHAAHAAYNASGTQGISVTDKINPEEEIHSVFITQNDTSKQILHGHNISEMTCAGKSGGISSERYKIFTPDENSDMLGDIYLNFEMDSEINEFTFIDVSNDNNPIDMYSFTEQSRTLDLKLAGSELKSLNVDLNTNEIPSVVENQNLDDLGFEVINQTRFIEIDGTDYQFIVGKAKTSGYNLAWRNTTTDEWFKFNLDKFQEINCLILETENVGSGSLNGIIMFGGLPTSGNQALLYGNLGDFPWPSSYVFEPLSNFPSNSSGDPYYKIVYTLEYYGSRVYPLTGPGRIIVSGSKDHTSEYFVRQNLNTSTPDGDKQTCVVITSNLSSATPTYQKVPFIHNIPFLPYSFDPIVSSSFSDTTGESFISIGDKSETVLGIDSNGKLIRSYDNGKNWISVPFYHGDGNTVASSGFYNHSDDSEFNYYIPKLDYVISNNIGGWLAIGKQGVQPDTYDDGTTPREDVDYYRQFVFYSDNEGYEWYPFLFTANSWPNINSRIHYKEIVEWLQPHLLQARGILEVPFKVSSGTEDSNGNTLAYSVILAIGVLSFFPSPPAIALGKSIATWPFTPGPYSFPEVTGTFDYEYIGVVNDRKRQIYYGYNSTNKGVITCRQENSTGPLSNRPVATRTSLFNGIYPRSIKYAYRDLLIGVFSNTNGDPDGITTYVYRFKKSLDGITWDDITINESDTISSTKDPLIEGDKYGNFIVAAFLGNKYNLYRYNINSSNLEILFDDTFDITDVFDMNFVSNEWQIALELGTNEYLLKSYDLTKWQKVENNFGALKVRKISYKHERINDVIYRTTSFNSPYKFTDVLAYNIMYNPDEGAGVFPYKAEALATYQGGLGGPVYYDINDNFNNNRNKEPNDIISVNGNIFIACNKNGTINVSNFGFPLVESSGGGTSYRESETIYGNTTVGKIPVTSFADNLRRLYSSPRNPEIIFTVGDFTDTTTGKKYGVILYRTAATSDIYDFAIEGGSYYWRVLMGPPLSLYNTSLYAYNKEWIESDFKNITDVALSKTGTQMVVVGEGKTDYNLVIFQTAYINDFREYITQKLDFEIIYTVTNLGNLWIVGGKPLQSDDWNNETPGAVFNNKCVAYTFDLVNWKYIDFTDGAVVPDVTLQSPPFFTVANQGTPNNVSDSINFEANDIKPLDVYGQTGILLQISFNYNTTNDTNGRVIPDSGDVGEKIYFLYVSGENLTIEQNVSYPEPSISFSQNRKQLVPSFTTNINNTERRLVASEYPNQFNLFYVIYQNDKFKLTNYISNYLYSNISESNIKPTQRFRKLIYVDEDSIIKRTNGHCYKIEKVKNENFVTGLNSARYVAVGKGNFSSIIWSDDLLFWNDADTTGIFDITFDVTHKHGIWVAIGTGNYQVAISKDGKKWTGIYTKYNDNLPEITTESVSFTSLAEFDTESDNITDILPYVPNLKGIFLRNLSLLRLFNRIEYHVGTQIWQTLTFDDIKAMLDTEFGAGEYKNLLKKCSIINKNGSTRFTTWIPGFTKTLNSKLETFVNVSENGSFPSGLLKDQKLSIKIYYNKLENVIGDTLESSDMNNNVFDNILLNTLIPTDRDTNYYIDSFLADNYGFQLGDTYQNVNGKFRLKYKTEIQQMRLFSKRFQLDDIEIDEFNKGIKQVPKITQSLYFDADNAGYLLLDLDSFNLYASYIIVSGWLTSGVYITDMNLELNGQTYQKVIEPGVIDYATKSYLGLNYNRYIFNGVDKEDGTGSLVIPLASTAYSGSSVPLDRYTSIRLRINFNTLAGPKSYINVTCVGTTTISYNNSTANIEMY